MARLSLPNLCPDQPQVNFRAVIGQMLVVSDYWDDSCWISEFDWPWQSNDVHYFARTLMLNSSLEVLDRIPLLIDMLYTNVCNVG